MPSSFLPDERTTLEALAAALSGGMDPSRGLSIFSDIIGARDQRQAQEQQATQGQRSDLQSLVLQRAQEGVPYDQARSQVEIMGQLQGVPVERQGAAHQALDTAYPRHQYSEIGHGGQGMPNVSPLAGPSPETGFSEEDGAAVRAWVAGALGKGGTVATIRQKLSLVLGPEYDENREAIDSIIRDTAQRYGLPVGGTAPAAGGMQPAPTPDGGGGFGLEKLLAGVGGFALGGPPGAVAAYTATPESSAFGTIGDGAFGGGGISDLLRRRIEQIRAQRGLGQ